MSDPNPVSVSPEVRRAFAPVLQAVARARQDLAARMTWRLSGPDTNIQQARRRSRPWSSPSRRASARLRKPTSRRSTEFRPSSWTRPSRSRWRGCRRREPCVVRDAGRPGRVGLRKSALGRGSRGVRPPKSGSYEPLDPPNLPLVKEPMELTICVSPEAGWSELEDFLGGTQKSLTVAMYQFTAPHIFDAVNAAVSPEGRQFELVLHPVPEKPPTPGSKPTNWTRTQASSIRSSRALQGRFEMAWATLVSKAHPDGLWASAYHIKVAVRDGNAAWVSSGNWQSSNQPNVHPFQPGQNCPPGFQRKYNRDYHAIFKNERIASIFEQYIKRDHDLSAAQAGAPADFAMPDLFVPEAEEAPEPFAAPPQFFQPLRLIAPSAFSRSSRRTTMRRMRSRLYARLRRASGSRTSTSTSAEPTKTSPNSSCLSPRLRTKSTRGAKSGLFAGT